MRLGASLAGLLALFPGIAAWGESEESGSIAIVSIKPIYQPLMPSALTIRDDG